MLIDRQLPARKLRFAEGLGRSIFPEIPVTVPMPAGTAVPPQVEIAAGPLSVAILVADSAGDAVSIARVDAELTCVVRTTNFATMSYDMGIMVTAEGGLSLGDKASAVSTYHIPPRVTRVTEFAMKA
jgi:hypothetical protein